MRNLFYRVKLIFSLTKAIFKALPNTFKGIFCEEIEKSKAGNLSLCEKEKIKPGSLSLCDDKQKFKIGDYVVFKNLPFREGLIKDIDRLNYLVQYIKIKVNKNKHTYSIKKFWLKEWLHESELLLL